MSDIYIATHILFDFFAPEFIVGAMAFITNWENF